MKEHTVMSEQLKSIKELILSLVMPMMLAISLVSWLLATVHHNKITDTLCICLVSASGVLIFIVVPTLSFLIARFEKEKTSYKKEEIE